MFDVGLVNSFETIILDQFHNPTKTGLHVERQGFELVSNAVVEQLYYPCHLSIVLQKCNTHK